MCILLCLCIRCLSFVRFLKACGVHSLVVQKEIAYASETKRKSEQMKAKIYSLRTQKTELSSKILKMQSTISSLKEELRTMESTLEDKQNEIKLLREKKGIQTMKTHKWQLYLKLWSRGKQKLRILSSILICRLKSGLLVLITRQTQLWT